MKALIEAYFEGLTSLEEEEKIRQYFQSETIAPDMEIYRPVFLYFAWEKERYGQAGLPVRRQRNTPIIRQMFRWTSVAAACLVILLIFRYFMNIQDSETSLAYIDGRKYTDINLVRAVSLNALNTVTSAGDSLIDSQIESLDLFLKK